MVYGDIRIRTECFVNELRGYSVWKWRTNDSDLVPEFKIGSIFQMQCQHLVNCAYIVVRKD